jgi:NAD(P)-dependent dehydrogenase (short-subunit alcohol dehydrogenase family)
VAPGDILLTGRRAVVTGAAQGIGAAVVGALRSFGCESVATVDRLPGCDATFDVRDADAVGAWAAAVGGPVHVLVNNAGGGFEAPFSSLSEKGQDALIRENFSQVATVTRAFLPVLADGAAVVNVTSIEAHRAAPGFAVYSAMKAAVANLTKSLALELGGRGIRINCVAPDVIPTPGTGAMAHVVTPLGGVGHVDDVAAAVVFLASDMAKFVTGTTLHVDGGNHAASGWRRQPDGTFRP